MPPDAGLVRWEMDPPPASLPAGGMAVTGHQAWLWHPGILVKYLLAAALNQRRGGHGMNAGRAVVVDHAAYHPWALDLPFQDGDRLLVQRFHAVPARAGLPAALYPPVEGAAVAERLLAWMGRVGGRACFDADVLCAEWQQVPARARLVDQVSELIRLTAQRRVGEGLSWPQPVCTLGGVPGPLIERLLSSPWRAAHGFNQALRQQPGTGLRPLHAGVDLVELPLWYLDEDGVRHRVLAQVVGGRFACVTGAGQTLAIQRDAVRARIAPNAVMLTAWQRSAPGTAVFIHGTGGGVYDRATQAWWQAWTAEALAPMAVATADARLAFDAPIYASKEHEHAVWAEHHARFNIDRIAGLDDEPSRRKRLLLDTMDDDRDKRRRRAAFDEIHRINQTLRQQHAGLLKRAQRRVETTRLGVANRRIAGKRDWYFGLYHPRVIRQLYHDISRSVSLDHRRGASGV